MRDIDLGKGFLGKGQQGRGQGANARGQSALGKQEQAHCQANKNNHQNSKGLPKVVRAQSVSARSRAAPPGKGCEPARLLLSPRARGGAGGGGGGGGG